MLNRTTSVIAALFCSSLPCFATTITFNNIPSQFLPFTGPYTESGFVVSVLSGSFSGGKGPLVYYGSGDQVPMPITMGTIVGQLTSAPQTSSALELRQVDGQQFLFRDFLAAHESFNNPNLTISGFDGTDLVYNIPADPSGHDFYVEVANRSFSDTPITALRLTYSYPEGTPRDYPNYDGTFVTGFAVDPVASTPEPSSLILLSSGGLLAALPARRRSVMESHPA